MVSSHFKTHDLTYVALTAGHVIPDFEDMMYVRTRSKDNFFIPLKVSETSKRCNGRPVKYKGQPPSFRDDCGLLKVDANDVKYFQVLTTNINLHYFYLKSILY